jgi:hypothetical protein
MKARKISLVLVSVLLLAAFGGMPVSAATSGFTGTVQFSGPWLDPVLPKDTGGTIHEWPILGFIVDTTDSRVNGYYLFDCKMVYPQGMELRAVHCTWTADTNNDQLPDWEGVMTITGSFVADQWNVTGKGLGQYSGLKVNFKAHGVADDGSGPVEGKVIGN